MDELYREVIKLYAGDPKQILHFSTVQYFAQLIGRGEKIDKETMQILEIAAIVHDIGMIQALEKHGISSGKYQELEGALVAESLLKALGYPQNIIERVCYLVGHHHSYDNIDGIDYQILVEADMLDDMYDSQISPNIIKSNFNKIFRTTTGKYYFRLIYNINED